MATEFTQEHVTAQLGLALYRARQAEDRPRQFAIEDIAMLLDDTNQLWDEVWNEHDRLKAEEKAA